MTQGSIFDGFGGMRRGLEEAGFGCKWALDILYGLDISQWDEGAFRGLGYVDLVHGGPPCQRVSGAASFSGTRSGASLWPAMLRCIKGIQPRWIIVEQPKGGAAVIVRAAKELQQLGYGCAGRIVDSKHWVPQQRARWFLIGRMGVEGMALWNYLYPDGQRDEGRQDGSSGETIDWESSDQSPRDVFTGSCSDCLRGGVFARLSKRKLALLGAGNAVTTPVARWLGERIRLAEGLIEKGDQNGLATVESQA